MHVSSSLLSRYGWWVMQHSDCESCFSCSFSPPSSPKCGCFHDAFGFFVWWWLYCIFPLPSLRSNRFLCQSPPPNLVDLCSVLCFFFLLNRMVQFLDSPLLHCLFPLPSLISGWFICEGLRGQPEGGKGEWEPNNFFCKNCPMSQLQNPRKSLC
jgi:hypothetical protein